MPASAGVAAEVAGAVEAETAWAEVATAAAAAMSPRVGEGMGKYPGVEARTFASLGDPALDRTGVGDSNHTRDSRLVGPRTSRTASVDHP